MAVKVPKGWYDISVPLKQGMNYFPTDPAPPKIYRYHDRALGARVTMSMLEIISHTGTHIDAPLHFIPDGSTISDMPLDATIGRARVIEIKNPVSIELKELKPHGIRRGDMLLLCSKREEIGWENCP
jgi:arylformamidase